MAYFFIINCIRYLKKQLFFFSELDNPRITPEI